MNWQVITKAQLDAMVSLLNLHPILVDLGVTLSLEHGDKVFVLRGHAGDRVLWLDDFATKRYLCSYLEGFQRVIDTLLDPQSCNYSTRKRKTFLHSERVYCPVCGEDITNRVEQYDVSKNVTTGRCPDCEASLKFRSGKRSVEVWEA